MRTASEGPRYFLARILEIRSSDDKREYVRGLVYAPTHAYATSFFDTEAITHPAQFVIVAPRESFCLFLLPFFPQASPSTLPVLSPFFLSCVNHRRRYSAVARSNSIGPREDERVALASLVTLTSLRGSFMKTRGMKHPR